MNVSSVVVSLCFMITVDYITPLKYTLLLSVCDCSLPNQSETDWSLFDDTAVTNMDGSSVILHLVGFSEEFCIISCQENVLCEAVQVHVTAGDGIWCHLLSYATSMWEVKIVTDSKVLLKGRNTLDICDGFFRCYSLQFGGYLFVVRAERHYDNVSDARNTCLDMPTLTGEFDLAIVDTWLKITALRGFLSGLPSSNDIWLYTGGEAGLGVSDPANKWTRTGAAIDSALWAYHSIQEPNSLGEHCVMITESYNGLIDTRCSGEPGGAGQEISTLCQYFPE